MRRCPSGWHLSLELYEKRSAVGPRSMTAFRRRALTLSSGWSVDALFASVRVGGKSKGSEGKQTSALSNAQELLLQTRVTPVIFCQRPCGAECASFPRVNDSSCMTGSGYARQLGVKVSD
jgi:hypothetical protein